MSRAKSLNSKEKKLLLEDRIPSRMEEVAIGAFFARLLTQHPEQNHRVTITLHLSDSFSLPAITALAYPTVDAGLLMCRVLMEFLGVRYLPGRGLRQVQARWSDDVSIVNFDLPLLTVSGACIDHPTVNPAQAEDILLRTLEAANKGIGHLTTSPARTLDLSTFASGCDLVLSLVNRHLYQSLSVKPIVFSWLSATTLS